MKKYQYLTALLIVGSTLLTTGCKDDFAELNQNPSAVTEGNIPYLFAKGILDFEPSNYTYWFYNANQMYKWTQLMVAGGGVTSEVFDGGTNPGMSSIGPLKVLNEIKFLRENMNQEDASKYEYYEAAMSVIVAYMGIFDTDFNGDIPHIEAAMALHGGTLTPKYDRVKDLYELWLSNLDKAIVSFTTAQDQIFQANQDVVYNGDITKWAKLANSLKLKIAARLISQDKAKAIQIAQQVANASCGYIDSADDDMIFNKCSDSSKGDNTYHWGNAVLQSEGVSKSFADFMINNRDPRIRFVFRKNSWSSEIVKLFFNAGKEKQVPKYILNNIDYTVNSDGKYEFKGWKAPGEPWVRYYGLPTAWDAAVNTAEYGDWFNWDINCRYDDSHTYRPFSMFNEEMLRGRITYTIPVVPGGPVIQDKREMPWYGRYMSTSEVNLYLAEFKLLGANLPLSADEYYKKGVRASVEEYDRLANLNQIPYYGEYYAKGSSMEYDPFEEVIDLKDGELDEMMSHKDYQLTGDNAKDLEKIYIQQTLNFMLSPIDVYVTGRRSGVPMIGSSVLPREDYATFGKPVTKIPRRMAFSAPNPTDLMFENTQKAYEQQGFTIGFGDILNSERLWQDQGAPQWGEGPKL